MKEAILLKYGEIVLKGANKSSFEVVLLRNIKRRLKDLGNFEVIKSQSTITIIPEDDSCDMGEAYDRMKCVYGITALSKSILTEKNMDSVKKAVDFFADDIKNARTFKVCAKRSDKTFPLKSPQICEEIGGYILSNYQPIRVDVHNPAITIWVEIRDVYAFVHANQENGAGGIPVGCGGKAALLLSGGIDSPVAGSMIAKRGLEVMAVHFASPPYTSDRAKLKVFNLCKKMSNYTGRIHIFVVSFTRIQDEIAKNCDEDYFTLIMRRFMTEIACKIAQSNSCDALITGESLGQVASQTVQALSCTDKASFLPILRPLIGMDKEEIVKIARKIDTFETSSLPFEDCCTVFTPRHPRTHPKLENVIREENKLDRQFLIADALNSVEDLWIDRNTEFDL